MTRFSLPAAAVALALACPAAARADVSLDGPRQTDDQLPLVVVDRDDVVVDASCRLRFVDAPIEDAAGDGVVQIRGDGLRVVCAEGVLRGAPADRAPDRYTGVGIVVSGRNVQLTGARVSGFKVGLRASDCDGLRVADARFEDLFRQRLGSDWSAEDPADWLAPHDNDGGEWVARYGGAVVVERSTRARLEGLRVRDSQNGLLFDRVSDSVVTRSDASFLSGWGLALWRSSDNVVRGNRFDYCVRGYSHGRYNRGQDSAGILLFEQSSGNLFELNSATHGGDGVFGFAGHEALGQDGGPLGFDHLGAGCNHNVFRYNDLSFAAAHGLELTFSFGNVVEQNLFEQNAICGIWLGYGRDSTIRGNRFVANGDAGYGAERGGLNAEHAQGLVIIDNTFDGDAVGVRLWTDVDAGLEATPWVRINGSGARGNALLANRFVDVDPCVELVAASRTVVSPLSEALVSADDVSRATLELELPADSLPEPLAEEPQRLARTRVADTLARSFHGLGPAERLPLERERRAVPAVGRASIVVGEWGPYDWTEPLLQPLEHSGNLHRYRLLGPAQLTSVVAVEGRGAIDVVVDRALPEFPVGPDGLARAVVTVRAARPGGVTPYRLIVRARGHNLPVEGVLTDLNWQARWFASPVDPREDRAAWLAAAEGAPSHALGDLRLAYGMGGPADVAAARGLPADASSALEALGRDHFGLVARATIELPAGYWRLATRSDDGVRVTVDGDPVIDNWTWHGPERDEAVIFVDRTRRVDLAVEHFELDGYALLEFDLAPAPDTAAAVEATTAEDGRSAESD